MILATASNRRTVGGSVLSQRDSLPIKADSFSAALPMIVSLPLSDSEKADAVRFAEGGMVE